MRGPRGGLAPIPMKNHKSIGYLSNTGPDPLKNHKATNSIIGPQAYRHCYEKALWSALRGIWIFSPSSTTKECSVIYSLFVVAPILCVKFLLSR